MQIKATVRSQKKLKPRSLITSNVGEDSGQIK